MSLIQMKMGWFQ